MRLLLITHEYFFRSILSKSQVTGQLPPQFPILGGLTQFEHMTTELGALLTVWGKHEDNQPDNARDRRDRPSGVSLCLGSPGTPPQGTLVFPQSHFAVFTVVIITLGTDSPTTLSQALIFIQLVHFVHVTIGHNQRLVTRDLTALPRATLALH